MVGPLSFLFFPNHEVKKYDYLSTARPSKSVRINQLIVYRGIDSLYNNDIVSQSAYTKTFRETGRTLIDLTKFLKR